MDNEASWLQQCAFGKKEGPSVNDTIVVALGIDICLDEIFSPCGHQKLDGHVLERYWVFMGCHLRAIS